MTRADSTDVIVAVHAYRSGRLVLPTAAPPSTAGNTTAGATAAPDGDGAEDAAVDPSIPVIIVLSGALR
jgi:hypothetical protein